MTKREQINLLNSMEIEESSASCGELDYILVADNETNRDILHNLGMTDEEINNCADYGCIEISGLICDIGEFWFVKKKFYFKDCLYEDKEGDIWKIDCNDDGYWYLKWDGRICNYDGDHNIGRLINNQPIENVKHMKFVGEAEDCERGAEN